MTTMRRSASRPCRTSRLTNGNTIVPASGVAVLYAGSNLDFTPARFTNAWGSGITLIPVNSLTSLTDADAIGLWPNRAAYNADDLGAGMNPRRSFAHASVSLNYASGFPEVENGRSIAWNGTRQLCERGQLGRERADRVRKQRRA